MTSRHKRQITSENADSVTVAQIGAVCTGPVFLERDFRQALSPAENDFTSKRQLGPQGRSYDESLPSFNDDGRRRHRDFTPPRDRDFVPPQLAKRDNYGNRIFFRLPLPSPTDNDARRYDQRRYNEPVQPQPWRGNRGYEGLRRTPSPRYRDGPSNERRHSEIEECR